jgi:hypothetical protein
MVMEEKRQQRLKVLRSQIKRLERRIVKLRKQGDRLTRWRLATFLVVLLVGMAILLTWGPLPWVVISLILLLPFILTVGWHRQVESSILKHRLLLELKQIQLARFTLDWEQIPAEQIVHTDQDHPFAHDLDLIGGRSLSRLLDVSITQEGGQRLRDWLLETEPDPMRTKVRQTNVRELIRMPAFRDRLVLNATLAGESAGGEFRTNNKRGSVQGRSAVKWSGQRLLNWLDSRTETKNLRKILIMLLMLVPVNLLLLAGYLGGWLPPFWIASWFVYAAILFSQSRKVEPLFRDASYIHDTLSQMAAVFNTLEKRSFAGKPGLLVLLHPLRKGSRRPSKQLQRANRLLVAVGLRINPVVGIILNVFFPWDIYFGYRMEQFKKDLVDFLPGWLDLWYELEALNGLANFGYLNPGAPFAEIITLSPESDGIAKDGNQILEEAIPPFKALNIGHPLIAAESRVGNDFKVDHIGSITIITGSNMAGKSSFLRTIGVNIRLALAGAPVLADSLNLVPFRVAASITVTDSVTDGFSFFYAEVRRLKALLEELKRPHPYPLFFLIDEIFRGTNNRERLIGSQSYVNELLDSFGAGAIATHDLELVKLADVNSDIRNSHFRDEVQGEHMVFDYKLHKGPCPTTNALRIMELAGLPVDQEGWQETITHK